jgi:Glycosyltransferase family 87
MSVASTRRADIAFFAALAVGAVAVVILGFAQLRIDKLGTDDFSTAWAGARALVIGADPYDVATWTDTVRGILERPLLDTRVYAYPPWVALALLPLGALAAGTAGIAWSVAGITAAIVAVRGLLRAYVPGRPWVHATVGALLLTAAPAVVALALGQWPFVFVAMLSAIVVLLRAERPVAAGLVAILMLAKPPLFVFTAVALAVRALWPGNGRVGRPFLMTAAAAGAATIALSWLIIPSWWPAYLIHVAAQQLTIEPVTLHTLFVTLFGPSGGWLAPPVLLGMVAAGLRFHPLSDGWLPVWLALSSAGALYSNTYDLLLLVVPVVLTAGALSSRRRSALVIVSGAILLFPVMWYLHTIYARGYAAGVALLMFVIITAALWPQRRELRGNATSARDSAGSSRP